MKRTLVVFYGIFISGMGASVMAATSISDAGFSEMLAGGARPIALSAAAFKEQVVKERGRGREIAVEKILALRERISEQAAEIDALNAEKGPLLADAHRVGTGRFSIKPAEISDEKLEEIAIKVDSRYGAHRAVFDRSWPTGSADIFYELVGSDSELMTFLGRYSATSDSNAEWVAGETAALRVEAFNAIADLGAHLRKIKRSEKKLRDSKEELKDAQNLLRELK